MAHTPGPWTYRPNKDYDPHRILGSDGSIVMNDEQYYPQCSDNPEDWPLIAAAPDLLAALQMVRDADEDCRKENDPHVIPDAARAKIDAAIAKAEGRS